MLAFHILSINFSDKLSCVAAHVLRSSKVVFKFELQNSKTSSICSGNPTRRKILAFCWVSLLYKNLT